METQQIERFKGSLRNLAQNYAASIEVVESILESISKESELDPLTYFKLRTEMPAGNTAKSGCVIDKELFSVKFQGKVCFLGNTYPFQFLARLAKRPNVYVANEELLASIWQALRSDAAVRSVVKSLRSKLRQAGMAVLAAAIDGSVTRHYALKLNLDS